MRPIIFILLIILTACSQQSNGKSNNSEFMDANTRNEISDTLIITPSDEFLNVRLSKFSTEIVGESNYPHHTIVLKEGKPYTGTVIKKAGIRPDSWRLFDVSTTYHIDDDDQTTFVINYKNGKFFGEYFFDDTEVTIRCYFDAEGKPDGKGTIIIKENNDWQKQLLPNIIPLISFSNIIPNQKLVLDQYDENIGKFDYQMNQEIRVRPNDMSLNQLLKQISIPDANLIQCYLLDSIVYTFKFGKLQDINYNSSCNFEYSLSPDNFIREMPVLNSASTDGDKFHDFDYSMCLFSPGTLNKLLGGWQYYYESIIDKGYGRFFSSLDQLPFNGEIKTDNYRLNVEYDIPLIKQNAKQLKTEEVFNANPADYGYGKNIYEIDRYFVKSIDLAFDSEDLKVHTIYKKNVNRYYLESNFVLKGANAQHTDNEYNGKLITAGDFNTGLIDSIFYSTNNRSMDVYFGTHYYYLLKKISPEKYLIEMKGRLALDQKRKLDVVQARFEAKLSKSGSYKSMINDGEARFIYSDGSKKVFKYKNGEVIID